MKKLILPTGILMIALLFVMCKKKSSDDSSTPTATPTCSDGIQNQGETGVDCGGPCGACPTNVCTGNGSNQYFPLAIGDQWVYYRNYYSSCPDNDTLTVESTETLGGHTYFKVRKWGDCGGGAYYLDFRIDATTGDVYQWTGSSEFILIPGSPTVGQVLASGGDPLYSGSSPRTVSSITATVNSGTCTYTNALKIDRVIGSFHTYDYYVKGVGFVYESSDYHLNSLTLH
jgi:hypothetical protein